MRALLVLLAFVGLAAQLAPLPAQADISFVGISNESNGSTTTLTPDEPPNTAPGDHVIAFGHHMVLDGSWIPPDDLIEIADKTEAGGSPDFHMWLGRKIRGATVGDGYQFDYSGSAQSMAVTLVTLRGTCPATLDVDYVEASHYTTVANTVNLAAQPIGPVEAGDWVLLFTGMTTTISGEAGPPAEYIERGDFLTGLGGSRGQYVASKAITTPGTETPGPYTHVDTTGTADARIFTLAICQAIAQTGAAAQRRRHGS